MAPGEEAANGGEMGSDASADNHKGDGGDNQDKPTHVTDCELLMKYRDPDYDSGQRLHSPEYRRGC